MKLCYADRATRSVADVVAADHLGAHIFVITRISVPKEYRGQGVGRQLLKEVLADADKEGVRLVLEINPYGDMTFKQLEAWYTRNGFLQTIEGYYLRDPAR